MMACAKLYDCVVLLLDNKPDVFENAARTLIMIMTNINSNQQMEKFRKIKLSSVSVSENLLPANGAMECLFACGFEEDADGSYLLLPNNADLKNLQAICSQIRSQVQNNKASIGGDSSSNSEKKTKPTLTEAAATRAVAMPVDMNPKWPKWRFPALPLNIAVLERQMYQKLKSSFEHVLAYEDSEMQDKARQCIPRERLLQNATRKAHSASGTSTYDFDDFYIIELMDWFRDEFFRWVSAPDCQFCEGKTLQNGMGVPSQDDVRCGAGRVEVYRCTQCGKITRFPRYNHPGKLLESRRGRCGEWANCFTLICRSSGYEARYVLDWTDHVWTEIFSRSQQRWLHCDPGEKALDKPLRYESGWGKKLTYVIAFSKDDICDVTWRYTAHHPGVILRRTECRENWLVLTIKALRDDRQRSMSETTRRIHQLRLLKEGGEFLSGQIRSESSDEPIGRQTGSLEWREARGEMGSSGVVSPRYVFKPTQSNLEQGLKEQGLKEQGLKEQGLKEQGLKEQGLKEQGLMVITYCCANNSYRSELKGFAEIYNWEAAVFESENIVRNVEVDWNMVYLARRKHSPSASISWKFQLEDEAGKTITRLAVNVSSTTFHSGRVVWSVTDNSGNRHCFQPGTVHTLDSFFCGAKSITLSAELSAGDGEDAWQHTQLFRQKRDSKQDCLRIEVSFE